MSSIVRMPPPDGQRHEDLLGRPAHHVDHDVPVLVAGRDVQEHQFVGPFCLVAGGNLDRVAGIAQVDEIRPLHDPAPIDIQDKE